MASKLSADDLFDQAAQVRKCIRELNGKLNFFEGQKDELEINHAPKSKIDELKDNISLLTDHVSDLRGQAFEIDNKAIAVTISDLDDAGQKIKAATTKVNNAVQKLNDIKDTLTIVKDFLDLGNAIVKALANTNPVIQIAGIIKAINTFAQQQSTSTSRGIPLPEETVPVVDRVTTRLQILPNVSYNLEISIKIQPAD